MVFCCVKQKRAGELCCGVIRASGYTADNGFLNILSEQDKGALLHSPRLRGDNTHHLRLIMCLVFSACLFPVTRRLQSVSSLSLHHLQLVCACVRHSVRRYHPFLNDQTRLGFSFLLACLLSPDLYVLRHVSSLHCWCQVKVLLRINRIHTIMSSDRMSPTLPQINPQPATSTLAPTCTHPAESASGRDVTLKKR